LNHTNPSQWSRYFYVFIIVDLALKASAKSSQKAKPADDPLRAYNEVVQNLIKNWESPVILLRERGFLPKNYEDTSKIKPNLDALMQRMERAKRDQTNGKDIIVRPREMREIKRPKKAQRNHRGSLASSGSMLSSLEQLKVLDSNIYLLKILHLTMVVLDNSSTHMIVCKYGNVLTLNGFRISN